MANPEELINVGGVMRKMGCLPPKPDFGGLTTYRAASPLIPRSVWTPVDLTADLPIPVWNQGSHGSCVGHGSALAFKISYLQTGGTVPVSDFSPTSLYALINGNRDAGAIVSDAMTALIKEGICTMAECPENVIYQGQIPRSAAETRKRFRVQEAFHVSSFDQMGTALMNREAVSFGITIFSGFNRPRSDGIVPTGGYILGGHCMCAVGLVKVGEDAHGEPVWGILVRNSWGTGWGMQGNCILTEWHFMHDGDLDAFVCRSAQVDPQDPHLPPTAKG